MVVYLESLSFRGAVNNSPRELTRPPTRSYHPGPASPLVVQAWWLTLTTKERRTMNDLTTNRCFPDGTLTDPTPEQVDEGCLCPFCGWNRTS
jgi:hypothetical protein